MKAVNVLLLLCVVAASCAVAAPVADATVRSAARTWALSGAALGVPHGTSVGDAKAYAVNGTNGFYAVTLEGGGTVFMSADDEIGPVLAFTSATNVDLSAESPLLNLLCRDVAARRGQLAAEAESGAQSSPTPRRLSLSSSAAAASEEGDDETSGAKAKRLWAALTSSAQPSSGGRRLRATADPITDVSAISDMRVEPIMASKWSQTEDKYGNLCYNYHTPHNYPCGCVATAAGQIMYRWKWPTEELPKFSKLCTVDGASQMLESYGDSRLYGWDDMVPVPGFSTPDKGREAIGTLLCDLGVAFGADYSEEGTGAYEWNVPGPMREHFKYASAYTYSGRSDLALHNAQVRQRAVLANLDAKRPVELYIISTRAGGHAVVADGYGYVTISGEEVEFTHINMGWAGTDDMWYNLPVIKTKIAGAQGGQSGGYTFEYLTGVTFNIHPSETGDLLTGRVLDDDDPVEGATVRVYEAGGVDPIAIAVSDAHGIYSFSLPGGQSYDVRAEFDSGGKLMSGILEDVYLKQTTVADTSTYTTYSDSDIGNSWGNDIDIAIPYVRVVVGAETNFYNNLNTALAAAGTMEDPVVEVFGPTRLKRPVTVVTNMTVCVVPDPDSDFPTSDDCTIVVLDDAVTYAGWALQVADGTRVAFSNVVFTAESGSLPYIDVMAGGAVSVADRIGIGKVNTQDADGFVLAGAFEPVGEGVSVACPVAVDRFSRFGSYECSEDEARSCASNIVDALDVTMMGSVGDEPGALVWDRVPVNPDIAVVYATNDTIGTTYYLSVDLLFKDYTNGAEVVFLKDCTPDKFTNAVVAAESFTIRSAEGSTNTVTAAKTAGFTVTDGAELVFADVVFTRPAEASTVSFVTLDDGSLVLEEGAVITGLKLAGKSTSVVPASAVYVKKGSVTMCEGSAISNCVATTGHDGKGSAVYLKGSDCGMDMQGGTITGCRAGHKSGAAVYAEDGAAVDVSGATSVYGNFKGVSGSSTNNVYVSSSSKLTLAGPLTGGIGVLCYGGQKEGQSFATVADGVDKTVAEMASGHFFNDGNQKLYAAVSEDGGTLVWAAAPSTPQPVSEGDADVRLVVGEANDTYATIDDALEVAGAADARIELLRDAAMSESLCVTGGAEVVLAGGGFRLSREGDSRINVEGATLVATNIVIDGGTGEGNVLYAKDGAVLRLEDGAKVVNVLGSAATNMVAPVVVWNSTFEMNPGAEMSDCSNGYKRTTADGLTAGAVLVYGESKAYFRGGRVTRCAADYAGGVHVANQSSVEVSGDTTIRGNKDLDGHDSNLVVNDLDSLVLKDMLTGRIGYTEGVNGNTNVFGVIDADFAASTTPSNLVVSARRFTCDKNGAKGMVATNATEAILVWSSAVGESTTFTNTVDGVSTEYDVVLVAVDDDDPEIVECEPFAFVSLEEVSEGKWKLTLKPGTEHCIYTLMASDDLENWTQVGDKKTLSADDIGSELEFVFETSGAGRFWKVVGADGLK